MAKDTKPVNNERGLIIGNWAHEKEVYEFFTKNNITHGKLIDLPKSKRRKVIHKLVDDCLVAHLAVSVRMSGNREMVIMYVDTSKGHFTTR